MRHGRFRQFAADQRGSSLIELALILPILLTLVMGVIDLGRAIQFSNILANMSREGANLAARSSEDPQYIINALASTAAPLAMTTSGRIFITWVIGTKTDPTCTSNCTVQTHVTAQSRSASGDATLSSLVYSCPSWGGSGACSVPSPQPLVSIGMTLKDGEQVRIVETAYHFTPMAGYVMVGTQTLYSKTVL